ncbi:MAG: hypothetical protein A3J37_03840 [Alphaproteobacteria bacterium RIFCSPHIGHO2_12_FULL_45_9]|nr:MAG: hypothetical protein A3J37_03840 [Alphaproteobacteria bacterium RIFCSPHIGHO2_12_FULL_45_9]
MQTTGNTLDWNTLSNLTFEKPDLTKFRAIQLAYDCLKAGAAHQIAFNAANEIAVAKFLNHQIRFGQILTLVERGLALTPDTTPKTLGDILAIDEEVRRKLN